MILKLYTGPISHYFVSITWAAVLQKKATSHVTSVSKFASWASITKSVSFDSKFLLGYCFTATIQI